MLGELCDSTNQVPNLICLPVDLMCSDVIGCDCELQFVQLHNFNLSAQC